MVHPLELQDLAHHEQHDEAAVRVHRDVSGRRLDDWSHCSEVRSTVRLRLFPLMFLAR